MRIPLSSANFSAPVYIEGTARNRVSVGESRENTAKQMVFDTKLGLVLIWPRREKKVRTVDGKGSNVVGIIVARADSFDVLMEHAPMLEESVAVKPGQK